MVAVQREIEYHFITGAHDDIKELIALYEEMDWWDEGSYDYLMEEIIEGSHCFIIAVDGEKIVGIARAISDHASDAYIQDVAVTAKYQRRGIAKQMLTRIIGRLNRDGIIWIATVSANKETAPVYQSVGFAECSNEVSMQWIKS